MPMPSSISEAWRERVARNPSRVAIAYFDGAMTAQEVDRHSDAIAVDFLSRGVVKGERVGIHLQNIPYVPLVLLALWKIGAIGVPLNPMYRNAELRRLVDDSGMIGFIASPRELGGTLAALDGSSVRWVLTASDTDFQTRNDPRVFGGLPPEEEATPYGSLREVLDHADGSTPASAAVGLDDPAFLTYTSGTTGPPKGAINSHGNYLHSVGNWIEWSQVQPGDVILAMAPLFHITGMSLSAGPALLSDTTLALTARFQPAAVAEAFPEHGVTSAIASITAFNAILGLPDLDASAFESVRLLYSGGAPIPPATIERFRERFGHYLHNAWGMTETTAGGIAVPPGAEAPVHAASGTLSIGKAMQNVRLRVIDEHGEPLPPGDEGELEFTAPQVISGYWRNPEATARTLPGGQLRTGDVAVIDEEGWVFLVDRLKDLINASGFKVWPREVEDALYEHPAVFEAAVVGEPDDYRGETVVAYVSLKDGHEAAPDEIIAFAKERLAAYKYPRRVTIVEELPKTATGKIRRADVRTAGTREKEPS